MFSTTVIGNVNLNILMWKMEITIPLKVFKIRNIMDMKHLAQCPGHRYSTNALYHYKNVCVPLPLLFNRWIITIILLVTSGLTLEHYRQMWKYFVSGSKHVKYTIIRCSFSFKRLLQWKHDDRFQIFIFILFLKQHFTNSMCR